MIEKYFELTDKQQQQYAALDSLYRDWNSKINVISRKDIDNLYEHHVLHSLALTLFLNNETLGLKSPISRILDLGTGGGFPGIPLAIMFPEIHFKLIDSIGKKVKVAQAVGEAIGLTNCEYEHQRAQECKTFFDVIVSRAVMSMNELIKITKGKTKRLLCLKGGDVESELKDCHLSPDSYKIFPISDIFEEEWFKEKYVIVIRL